MNTNTWLEHHWSIISSINKTIGQILKAVSLKEVDCFVPMIARTLTRQRHENRWKHGLFLYLRIHTINTNYLLRRGIKKYPRWPRFQARAPPISFLTILQVAQQQITHPLPSRLTSICTYYLISLTSVVNSPMVKLLTLKTRLSGGFLLVTAASLRFRPLAL